MREPGRPGLPRRGREFSYEVAVLSMVQEKSIKGSSGATSAFSQGLADLASVADASRTVSGLERPTGLPGAGAGRRRARARPSGTRPRGRGAERACTDETLLVSSRNR
jgi:hypothetical protein